MTGTITSDTARLPVMLTQLRLPTVARALADYQRDRRSRRLACGPHAGGVAGA